MSLTLHQFLDCNYDGEADLLKRLEAGESANSLDDGETPLHVATRRRRTEAVAILLDQGANIDALNGHGKTAYAHAVRRGFNDVAQVLITRGANTGLNEADRLAVAIVEGRLDEAQAILTHHPNSVQTGNPEEDRLLADIAGRLFGQPENARLLIDAGAPLEFFIQFTRIRRLDGRFMVPNTPGVQPTAKTFTFNSQKCSWMRVPICTIQMTQTAMRIC